MLLVKYIAHCGVCSRREAVEYIKQGAVTINGVTVTLPNTPVEETDAVKVNGKLVKPLEKVYLMLNKPKGYICSTADEQDRETVYDLLPAYKRFKLFTVGRLDKESTGLILVTNDGDWAQKLAHPRFKIQKEYQVLLNKPLDAVDFGQLKRGVRLFDGVTKPDKVVLHKNNVELTLVIHSGKNRIIRRIFEHLGYKVKELNRIAFGKYRLGTLKLGCYRQINANILYS
jgi:23S rRNA pseudouridine2605 synthase